MAVAERERVLCRMCETRKPKRFCPGVGGEICPQCCGEQREEKIQCPLDCEYLIEGRKHERPPRIDPRQFPHPEISVGEDFIEEHRELFTVISLSLIRAAHETPGAVDNDIQDCLEASIKTYLTLDAGIIYETKPANLVGAAVQHRLAESIADFKKFAYEKTGVHSVKDSEVLAILVFLQRLELSTNNQRRYGRAFLSSLMRAFGFEGMPPVANEAAPPDAPSSLIV